MSANKRQSLGVARIFLLSIFITLFVVAGLLAQEENVFLHPKEFYKKYFPHLRLKSATLVDTSYIKTYPNYLTASARIILPRIYYNLNPIGSKSEGQRASSKFRTDVNTIIAFAGSYKFVTAGFAISMRTFLDKNVGYAHTTYRTATIKYNNPKYSLEFKYIKVKGLTDINKRNNLDNTQYLKRPDITAKEFRVEGIYNFSWKKYSLIAPVDFTQRQVKSRVGYLLKAGIYNNQMSSRNNLISERQSPYFEEFTDINRMIGYSVKIAPGIGANLVFMRRFYLSSSIFSPYNLYFNRLYSNKDLARKEASLQVVLDGMVSLGFQSRRFYSGLTFQAESKGTKQKYISSFLVYSYIGMNVGYRFKAPTIVKKIYKTTMPPGG